MLGRSMRWVCTLALAFVIAMAGPVSAQTTPVAEKLNAGVIRLYRAGKFSEAIPLAQRVLALRETAFGPDHPDVATALNSLAVLYWAQGSYGDAEPLYKRALGVYERALGPDHADVGTSLNNLALLYQSQGRYAEAELPYKRALGIYEKALGPNDPRVGNSLNNLAAFYKDQGLYDTAEPLYKRGLKVREKALGPDHPEVGQSLNSLAELKRIQGRYGDSEPLFKRALGIYEKALGPDHPGVGNSLNGLAVLYSDQGRYQDAEPPYKRSLSISEKALGPDHPSVATSLNNIAELYRLQGRYAEAEPIYKRSLSIYEKALGPDHPDVGTTLNNLAGLYQAQGRTGDAEPLFKRFLAISDKALGPDNPDVALALNSLAGLYLAQGRTGDAEPLYERALSIRKKALSPDNPDVATSLNNLAALAFVQRDWARAADFWRRSTSVTIRRSERGTQKAGGSLTGKTKSESERESYRFWGLVKATHRLAVEGGGADANLPREMFQTAQWAQSSEAAASLAQMAARGAAGNPDLAGIARERQDLVVEWQGKDKLLIAARSEPPQKRNATAEQALADRLIAVDARLAAIDARFAKDFPDHAALANPKPISVADVQSGLRDDEALVLFLDTVEFKPLPEETFLWVVTNSDVRWLRSDLGTEALTREVAALRCGLDATAWWAKDSNCSKLTSIAYSEADHAEGKPLPFDAARAHVLYKSLLGEAADLIKGKHLLVVPSGALTTLPFQVLVTEAPKSKDLAAARWLIRDHPITVVPSVASLTALRRTGRPSAAPKPMIGFGNPLLDGNQAHPQHGAFFKQQAAVARAQTACAKSGPMRTAALRAVSRSLDTAPLSIGHVADLAHLRLQSPLPESADELCEVARSVGGNPEDVLIGARATEAEVKRLSAAGDLAKYRLLHFATHGTLAGQLSGTNEPGLILTPPATATADDDGYLSGSEIAGLKLDADWVILSACNTAGGAGEGAAAEALSGLARVFFYAGARALLVSHWEVDSDAAVKLVIGAIGALAKDTTIGRAEALRRAMLSVMADSSRPADWVPASHPSVWAPFVIVGEGGAGR